MKKIDELFDDFELQNEDITVIENFMTKDEKERIKNLTMEKAGLKQDGMRIKRRIIISLVAVMTIILSFAVVFAQGGINNIFNRIFGDNQRYVNEMGTIIDKSFSANGITLHVDSMLGDENSFYIIFELIKENGESFNDSDYIYFEKLHLNFKGSGGYIWNQIKDDNENDNKATFLLTGDTAKKTVGKEFVLNISDFTEYNISDIISSYSPYEFLSANTEYLEQKISEDSKQLPIKGASVLLDSKIESITVDNIGFIDDKMCISVLSKDDENMSLGKIYFQNKQNPEELKYDENVYTEEKNGMKYYCYIFDIKNLDELNYYDLKYNFVKKINFTSGEWNLSFKADYKNNSSTVYVNKFVEVFENKYLIKKITYSPISLHVEFVNNIFVARGHIDNTQVTVIMKDGSNVEIQSSGSSSSTFEASFNLIFTQPVDVKQIDKVKINDIEVDIN